MLLCIHVPYYRIELIGHIVSDQQTLTRRLVAEAPKQLGLLARRRSRPASVSHFMYTRMGEGSSYPMDNTHITGIRYSINNYQSTGIFDTGTDFRRIYCSCNRMILKCQFQLAYRFCIMTRHSWSRNWANPNKLNIVVECYLSYSRDK